MQKLPAFLTLSLLMVSIPASSQTLPEGVERIQIPVGDMVFDALAAGAADGELVLLLHGFPQFRAILGQFSMSEADVETYLGILGTEEALGAALNWYRANIADRLVLATHLFRPSLGAARFKMRVQIVEGREPWHRHQEVPTAIADQAFHFAFIVPLAGAAKPVLEQIMGS